MKTIKRKEWSEMSYEEKACYCESQADLMGEGFCRDNYLEYARKLRGKIKKPD